MLQGKKVIAAISCITCSTLSLLGDLTVMGHRVMRRNVDLIDGEESDSRSEDDSDSGNDDGVPQEHATEFAFIPPRGSGLGTVIVNRR